MSEDNEMPCEVWLAADGVVEGKPEIAVYGWNKEFGEAETRYIKAQPLPDDVQGALDEVNKAIETLEGDGDENLVLDHLYDARAALVAQNQVVEKPVCGEGFKVRHTILGESALLLEAAIGHIENMEDKKCEGVVYNDKKTSLEFCNEVQRILLNFIDNATTAQETCKENPTQGGGVEKELCGDAVNGGFIRNLCFTVWNICHNPTHEDGNSDWADDTLPTVQDGVKHVREFLQQALSEQAAEIARLREALELANEHFPDLWDEKEVPYHKMGKLSQDRMKIKKALQSSTSQATEKVDGWQSIESAPKGGGAELVTDPNWIDPPLILLRFPCGSVSAARWDWYYAEGGRGCKSGVAWIEPTSAEELIEHYGIPTHWQALPPVKEGE